MWNWVPDSGLLVPRDFQQNIRHRFTALQADKVRSAGQLLAHALSTVGAEMVDETERRNGKDIKDSPLW